MRKIAIQAVVFVVFLASCVECAKAAKGPGAEKISITQCAPGVWRLRVGTPEDFVPSRFRTIPPCQETLKGFSDVKAPFDFKDISAYISSSRTLLEIPCVAADENFYGFGLDEFSFVQDGQRKRTEISASGAGNAKNRTGLGNSHAAIPLYFSTKGYGVLVDTSRAVEFHLKRLIFKDNPTAAIVQGDKAGLTLDALYDVKELAADGKIIADIPIARGVDVYVFAGSSLKDALQRYVLYSGGGVLPPLWGLGVKFRTFVDADQALVEQVRDGLRERKIPCDMLGLEPNWQSHSYPCSFVWRKEKFPDPDAFIRTTREKGFKMNLWFHPYVSPAASFFEQILPWSGSYLSMRGVVPDLLTPTGSKLLMDQLGKLVHQGICGFKVDECDRAPSTTHNPNNFPNATRFPSGVDGEVYGQALGIILQNQLSAVFRSENRRTMSDVRASGAFSAPLPFVLYSDTQDLVSYVRQVCNAGFSGLLWSPETRNAGNLIQLQRRLAVSALSHQCLIDPWFNKRPLWENYKVGYGNWNPEALPAEEQAKATQVIRYFCEMRMRLIPYLYSAYNEYRLKGIPPIRPLVVDFPNDRGVRRIDDAYMIGDALLFAPFLGSVNEREVYLPAGADWFDVRTGVKFSGGTKVIAKTAPLNKAGMEPIALYIRANSLLPLAEPVEYVVDKPAFKITVHQFGEHPEPFTLYSDDGTTYDYEKGRQNEIRLSVTDGKGVVDRRKTTDDHWYQEILFNPGPVGEL